jgi:hypothetical protein
MQVIEDIKHPHNPHQTVHHSSSDKHKVMHLCLASYNLRPDVCVGFVCWLRLDFVLVLFVLDLVSVP